MAALTAAFVQHRAQTAAATLVCPLSPACKQSVYCFVTQVACLCLQCTAINIPSYKHRVAVTFLPCYHRVTAVSSLWYHVLPVRCYQCKAGVLPAIYWCGIGVGLQEKCGLPWVVGLDLTTTDTDMLNLVSALAVKRLDPPEDLEDPPTSADAPSTYYLCLMADNRRGNPSVSCRQHLNRFLDKTRSCKQGLRTAVITVQAPVRLAEPHAFKHSCGTTTSHATVELHRQ